MKFKLKNFNRNVTDEELLKDLVSAHEKLKSQAKKLTFRSYKDVGKYSPQTICERFGTWNDGLQKAGLVPVEEKNTSLEMLLDNIKVVWIAKGKQPVYRDMSMPPSKFTGSTYNARFSSWRKALEIFVETFSEEEHDIASSKCHAQKQKTSKRTSRNPSLTVRFMVFKRDKFSCSACGRQPLTTPGLELEVDHIIPWSKGGETVLNNLQTLCFDCNRGKSDS